MRRLLIVCSLFLLPYSLAFSQTSFTTDATAFPKEVEAFLNETKRDDAREIGKVFTESWAAFSSSQQGDIIELANIMRAKKMLVYPYFLKYFTALMDYQVANPGASIFDSWKEVTVAVINNQKQGNNKKYEDYLDFSISLFTENSIFQSAGHRWQLSSNAYELLLENDTPVLRIEDIDLLGIAIGDTLLVQNTGGKYFPLEEKWYGTSGLVDWQRAGFSPGEAYVEFGKYMIDCSQSEYTVDTAQLFLETIGQNDVSGKFTDRILSNNKPETSSYPRFQSFSKKLDFGNIAPKVELVGGLTLEGSKMIAYGTKEEKAEIKIYRYDKLLGVVARSKVFAIEKDVDINASQAEVNIMLGKDSIYHAGVQFKYDIENRQLVLLRGKNGIENSAFYDEYHKYELTADLIYWDMNEPYLYIRNLGTSGATPVNMESFNYYDVGYMNKFQNIADFNVIDRLKQISDQNATTEFYTEDLAKKLNPTYSANTIRNLLYKLVEDGFIDYDDQLEIVRIRYKTFQYVEARKKKIDYDDLKIVSITDSINGIMDLRSYNLNLRGVNDVVLSDSSFVVVFPSSDSLIMKKNREMDFGGSMFAGWLDMSGRGFSFYYDDFKVGLSAVDSVLLNIPTGEYDEHHLPRVGPIKSVIQNVTGTLFIDTRDNKSGRVPHANYPILKTDLPSYVYYDRKQTLGGIYNRDDFYFELDPFEFDSLKRYKVSSVAFTGKLVSAGIFPELKETLRIQPDLSLGFRTTRTDLDAYGGKGKYTNQISLDNTGLRGKGTIKFLPSVTQSQDIVFYPDSMNAKSQSFDMEATVYNGIEFPKVHGEKNRVHWIPNNDSMIIRMDTIPFRVFDGVTTLKGDIVLQSRGMSASGTVDWADATLASKDINFGKNKMNSDTADFTIKSLDPKKFALRTTNVSAKIDFDKRVGDFVSNTEEIATEFPYNQYRTSINQFRWEMEKKLMTFKAPEGTEAEFTSVHPDQDSLSFNGENAQYDLQNFILRVNKVEYITVVDSRIFPDSGKVVIEAEAKMRTLMNAKLVMDTIDEYHQFNKVTANIFGKQSFKASGDYSFVNITQKSQTIHFEDIGVYKDDNRNLHAYAKGTVDTSMHIHLIPKISFKGSVNIESVNEPVQFKGYAKLDVTNPKVKAEWFTINNVFTKDSNYVYYTNPENESGRPVTAGIVFESDSSDLYTSFFSAKKNSKDKNLFTANGIAYYDEASKEYIAGDYGKLVMGNARGNVLKYNDATGKVNAEGKMNMGLNFGLVDVQAAGQVNTDVNNNYVFNLSIGLKFDLDKDLLALMAKDIVEGSWGSPAADYTTDAFLKTFPEFMDAKQEKIFNQELNLNGSFAKSDALPFTIFISSAEMKWDKTSKAFYSTKPISIAFVGDKSVTSVVQGYLEFGYKRSGDYMNLYIPAINDGWYFFNYTNGNMQIATENPDFSNQLIAVDPDKRRTRGDDGKMYQYNPGTENKKNTFLNRIKFLQEGG